MKRTVLIIGLVALAYMVFLNNGEAHDGRGDRPVRGPGVERRGGRRARALRRSHAFRRAPSMSRSDRRRSFQRRSRVRHRRDHRFFRSQPRPSPFRRTEPGLSGGPGSSVLRHGAPAPPPAELPGRPGSAVTPP
jgi:hypothetical protein